MNQSKNTSYKVAVGGVVSALCLALMFMTGVFPLLSMAIPIYAGALMIVVTKEVSTSWAFAAYMAVSILSVFITPDKEAATLFIIFFGYYPIIFPKIDRLHFRPLRGLIKLGIFNSAIVVWYKVITFVFGMYDLMRDFAFLGSFALPVIFVVINLVFLLYDYTIRAVENVYVNWFRPTYFGKKSIRKTGSK